MNRCSKCNNELVAGARFCNICGTPVPATAAAATGAPGAAATASSETPLAPAAPTGLKRTINPDIRRIRPLREGHTTNDSRASDASQAPAQADTPDKTANSIGSDAPKSKAAPLSTATPAADPDKTVPLPPPPQPALDKAAPSPSAESSHVPGIIRPIVTSASLRQNTPLSPGQTPPNPMSPLPPVPNTPSTPGAKAPQTDNTRFPRPVNIPAPGSRAQDNQRQAEGFKLESLAPRQQSEPTIDNNAPRQQTRLNAEAPSPQTPQPSLHEMPTNYLQLQNGNGNDTNSTANRQELPLFSPESFAYTSKAAQHWRSSWRDLQNAEAGPAEDVSKGQATVPAPLANRKDSFLRLRAIRSKQKQQDGGEKNFGFWVTLFLMICLIGGLAAYIVYSYLPNNSIAVHIAPPTGGQPPSFNVVGAQILTTGQSLRAHGDHFGANDPITFLLDSAAPVLASSGNPLSTQSDSHGSFDVTMLVGKNWAVGAHVIAATDTRAKLSAYLDIQVNPSSSPVASSNNTYLAFTLNGQPIDHLSFTAQIGQPAPPAQRITFTNSSGTPLQWSAAASTSWLTILDSDYAGQLDISQPHSMGISVNPVGLAVTATGKAPYTGEIVFTINGSTQLTLRVQLTIIDATPEMVFSPNPLVATAKADGTCQPGATLTFINLGTTVISWSATPDLQNKIQFVNDQGIVTESGSLQPSGMDGDTEVVTLRCSGVQAGAQYTVHVFANSTGFSEIVQIG